MSSLFYLVFNLTYLSIVPFVGLGDHKNMVLSNNNNNKCADNILREKKKKKALKPGPDKDEERKYKCLLAFCIVLIFYETFISSLLFFCLICQPLAICMLVVKVQASLPKNLTFFIFFCLNSDI